MVEKKKTDSEGEEIADLMFPKKINANLDMIIHHLKILDENAPKILSNLNTQKENNPTNNPHNKSDVNLRKNTSSHNSNHNQKSTGNNKSKSNNKNYTNKNPVTEKKADDKNSNPIKLEPEKKNGNINHNNNYSSNSNTNSFYNKNNKQKKSFHKTSQSNNNPHSKNPESNSKESLNCNKNNFSTSNNPFSRFLSCADFFIFEFDEEIIEKLFICTIMNMSVDQLLSQFKKDILPFYSPSLVEFNSYLDEQITNKYNEYIKQIMSELEKTEKKREYLLNLFKKLHTVAEHKDSLRNLFINNFQKLFSNSANSPELLEEFNAKLDLSIKNLVLSFVYFHFIENLCQFKQFAAVKVTFLKKNLNFLSSEILKLTSEKTGIFPLANALNISTSSRFADENEFDEVFDAVEKVADVIEELADIYRSHLKIMKSLFPFAICSESFSNYLSD